MISSSVLAEKLISRCAKPPISQAALAACCKDILDNLKFDCVFLARASSAEEAPVPLAFEGKEEVMETCLYRLGVEERVTLAKLPLKTYLDMTGKPLFNKSGSLRIQKPNSGVFMVLNRPKKIYILLGCAHQNSQAYDQRTLEELSALWKQWQEPLERAVTQGLSQGKAPSPPAASEELSSLRLKLDVPSTPAFATPLAEKPTIAKKDGRRPVALVDEVTRLFNKDYFSECLSIEVERAKRYSRLMSLMFLSVAPVEGMAGKTDENQIATQVAEILSKSLRRVDIICRLDKYKYGIILPDTANNTYGIIAKRIFKFFKQIMGETPSVFLNISASTYPKHAADHNALLENAEKLLVQAQDVGPNKAVLPE
jgi:diguanylate cyclase (GGDEF)-like protein